MSDSNTVTITSPNGQIAKFTVEVADTTEERKQGLMHRTSMPQEHGMLFVFQKEQPLSFWMKNTLIPLDILYIDASNTVVNIQTMQPCTTEVCTTYPSNTPVLYALEINAGLAKQYNITTGATINFGNVLTAAEL